MIQRWVCELCGRSGSVRAPKDVEPFHMSALIGKAHRKADPECADRNGLDRVRVPQGRVSTSLTVPEQRK